MLETLDRASIKGLILDIPQSVEPDDISKSLTEGDWAEIKGVVPPLGNDSFVNYLERQSQLHLLDPNKSDKLDIKGDRVEFIKDFAERYWPDMPQNAVWPLVCLSVFAPESVKHLQLPRNIWDHFRGKVRNYNSSPKQVLPVDETLALTLQKKTKVINPKIVENLRTASLSRLATDHFYHVIGDAWTLKILDPEGIAITHESLKRVREESISTRKRRDWERFLTIAPYYRILMAEKITMSNRGLTLSFPPTAYTFGNQNTLPERRRF